MAIIVAYFYVKRLCYVNVSTDYMVVIFRIYILKWSKWNKKSPMLSAPGTLSLSKNTLFSVT